MRSIIASIHPEHCENIASGRKGIEIRKTAPEPPFKVYVYCTKPNNSNIILYSRADGIIKCGSKSEIEEQKKDIIVLSGTIIGEFICNEVYGLDFSEENMRKYFPFSEMICARSCVDFADLVEYNPKYGWNISGWKAYDRPRELCEFRTPWTQPRKDSICTVSHKITRAPQSWCYVEEYI